jgi:hypothetical protein
MAVAITKISWLILFKKIIPVYSENHARPISIKCSYWLSKRRYNVVSTFLASEMSELEPQRESTDLVGRGG